MVKRRAAILVSGRGSNMAALLQAAAAAAFPVKIVLVLSNQSAAPALALARERSVPTVVVEHRPFRGDRAAHEAAVVAALEAAGADLVCLAGYMRRLTSTMVDRYAGRMLNVHPSLLPAFPGLDTHARALRAGVKLHGCTVHLVTERVDEGPILAQAAVPVLAGDDPATLGARVLAQEHVLYPAALAALAGGDVRAPVSGSALCNPLPLAAAPA